MSGKRGRERGWVGAGKRSKAGGRPKGVAEELKSESHLKPASAKAAQSPPFQGGRSPSLRAKM